MKLTDPSNTNPRMHSFLIFLVKFSADSVLNAARTSMIFKAALAWERRL